jgi:protein-disulfide isomerase
MKILQTTIALSLFAGAFLQAGDFSPEQKKEIQLIIRDYLIDHPEVIVDAVGVLQERQQAIMHEKAIKVITKEAPKVFASKSPFLGNKDGQIFIVEFIDYNCPHCRHISDSISQLIKDNSNLKVIIKEFPVLGEASVFAAKAALAAYKQGKFAEIHNAFMSEKILLKNARVLEIARELGLNIALLQKDMETVEPELVAVKNLAIEIDIQATPALIISTYPIKEDRKVIYIPGAVETEILQDAINFVK